LAPNPSRAILIALYTVWYNFCRIHKTLRVTPGMEAGIADHVWTIEELVGLLDRAEQRATGTDSN